MAAVADPSTLERLALLPSLTAIPRAQLEWLVAHGVVRQFVDGSMVYSDAQPEGLIYSKETPDPGLVVLLAGCLSIRRMDRTGVAREVRRLVPGRVSGMLPYSRLKVKGATGFIVADGLVEILLIASTDIREMTRECYDFTAFCVSEMLDRARAFTADDRHQEKMAALGRLSAGIAHELNNPSSAIGRSAREMDACQREVVAAARALGAAALGGEQLAACRALEMAAERTPDQPLSSLAHADREDAIELWLADRGIDTSFAHRLANTGLTIPDLDAASRALPAEELGVVLAYTGAKVTAAQLTAEVENAARRIHSLVTAVKKHTHMDRAPSVEAIQLEGHLRDTLALVGSQARAKSIALDLSIGPDLPAVQGVAGELNQVWLNLLDNAVDAAPEDGHVSVTAGCERGNVVVRVIDDGPGIAAGDLGRIFDPFFTTKPVGQGAGLGLDVVRSVVQSHRGLVEVDSRPGYTEVRVSLPAVGQ